MMTIKSKSGHLLSASHQDYFSFQYEICIDYIYQEEKMMVGDFLCYYFVYTTTKQTKIYWIKMKNARLCDIDDGGVGYASFGKMMGLVANNDGAEANIEAKINTSTE